MKPSTLKMFRNSPRAERAENAKINNTGGAMRLRRRTQHTAPMIRKTRRRGRQQFTLCTPTRIRRDDSATSRRHRLRLVSVSPSSTKFWALRQTTRAPVPCPWSVDLAHALRWQRRRRAGAHGPGQGRSRSRSHPKKVEKKGIPQTPRGRVMVKMLTPHRLFEWPGARLGRLSILGRQARKERVSIGRETSRLHSCV